MKRKKVLYWFFSYLIFHRSFDKMLKITKINTDALFTVFVYTMWVVLDNLPRPIFVIRETVHYLTETLRDQNGLEYIPKLMLIPFNLSYK